jgi:hypothetical protein
VDLLWRGIVSQKDLPAPVGQNVNGIHESHHVPPGVLKRDRELPSREQMSERTRRLHIERPSLLYRYRSSEWVRNSSIVETATSTAASPHHPITDTPTGVDEIPLDAGEAGGVDGDHQACATGLCCSSMLKAAAVAPGMEMDQVGPELLQERIKRRQRGCRSSNLLSSASGNHRLQQTLMG